MTDVVRLWVRHSDKAEGLGHQKENRTAYPEVMGYRLSGHARGLGPAENKSKLEIEATAVLGH